ILAGTADDFSVQPFDPGKPGLERFPSGYVGVDIIAVVNAMQRQVGESPFTRIETVPLVNEADVIFAVASVAPENRLAPIGIAQPFAQRQHAGEVARVSYSLKHAFRQVIKDLALEGIANEARSKLQARFAGNGAPGTLHAQLGSIVHQPLADEDDLWFRNR